MKQAKRFTAVFLLAIFLVISILPVSAAQASPASVLVYSTQSNSGTRHVVCTTLEGTGASAYYTGTYGYESLSALSSSQLYTQLKKLMKDTHRKNSSYADCRDMAVKTDCENNDGRINLIYSSVSVTRADYQSGNGWNREHVWPKSLGGYDTAGPGADLHHIRPSDNKINGTRGNQKYGNVNGGSNATGGSLVGSSVVGGTFSGGYFEPLDNVKGDVARICLYMYVRYGNEYNCGSITTIFQSVDVLLEWCEIDPVDTWEMGRNEVVAAYQGNRNVFIDYPEYAWLLFDRAVPSDMTTPGAGESNDNTPCTHAAELRNEKAPTCKNTGYTGDTYCKKCNLLLSEGTVVSATGVHSNTELRGYVAVTCGANGYSGDTHCKDCGILISTGTVIVTTGAHVNTEVRNRVEPSCNKEGYSGDTYCKDCGTLCERGATLSALGDHLNTEIRNKVGGNCLEEGYTGDTYCRDCGILLKGGMFIIPSGEHLHTQVRDQIPATCIGEGYTGDTYCTDCNTLISRGMPELPSGIHSFDEGMLLTQPTKDAEGLKKVTCTVCGATEEQSVPRLPAEKNFIIIFIAAGAALGIPAVAIGAGTVIFLVVRRVKIK